MLKFTFTYITYTYIRCWIVNGRLGRPVFTLSRPNTHSHIVIMTKDFDLNATESADQINFILVRSNVTMSQTAIFKQVQMKHLSFQVENIKCVYGVFAGVTWCVGMPLNFLGGTDGAMERQWLAARVFSECVESMKAKRIIYYGYFFGGWKYIFHVHQTVNRK